MAHLVKVLATIPRTHPEMEGENGLLSSDSTHSHTQDGALWVHGQPCLQDSQGNTVRALSFSSFSLSTVFIIYLCRACEMAEALV